MKCTRCGDRRKTSCGSSECPLPIKLQKLRVGELVYLKDIGPPYSNDGSRHDTWDGVSGTVKQLNAGARKNMILVETIRPMKCGPGHKPMTESLFHPEKVVREDRPWLRKNLKQILTLRKKLFELADLVEDFKFR